MKRDITQSATADKVYTVRKVRIQVDVHSL
jgi:hypothetical protein